MVTRVEATYSAISCVAMGALILRARRYALCRRDLSSSTTAPAEAAASEVSFKAGMFSLKPDTFGMPAAEADARAISEARLVVVGEIHSVPPCIELQRRTAVAMMAEGRGLLHIVLEHLNFEQQPLLDAYADGTLGMAELLEQYRQGTEGHDLVPYEPLLALGRLHRAAVRLHAGFIPRSYARMVMRESPEAALAAARDKGYVSDAESLDATDAHYDFFESLLTGRNRHATPPMAPTDKFRKMFPAQVIKDAAMAHKVLVICGVGHSGYSHGVPERILRVLPWLQTHRQTHMYRVWCLPVDPETELHSVEAVRAALCEAFGPPGVSDPADLCLAFAEVTDTAPSRVARTSTAAAGGVAEEVKAATAAAYNAVGSTAHLGGDVQRAVAIMRRLKYDDDQIGIAGADSANFQGVASPHQHARLQPGERVVDLGSGLGIDSFIAAAAVTAGGARGSVVGIDLAEKEVRHATARAAARGLVETAVRFAVGDLERLPLADESADAVISNGAFCLVPNKATAFAEVFRILKPGGRFAIATSVVLQPLEEGQWPLCMRMFSELHSLRPLATAAGFTSIELDTSDMAMAFELPVPDAARVDTGARASLSSADGASRSNQRNQVHVGSPEFKHLRDLDVNAICGRVVISGIKPA
ncbi:methyltransferase type 11 [Chrysochromulina tobinii]|uniref:Methyltransferase type 11 n=1 Tax=Chrysochromulina tobinii TaxID=1460289 RepID=A0A0M0JDS6_9EUKA|nr:methyltransferase type 11 [Chrysochromulina tobinii]|eukprot:KOO24749.1 methyltransferase type 11 [Chrysochromulina sp. CCMP291]